MAHALLRADSSAPAPALIVPTFDSSGTPFAVLDAAGRFTYANPALRDLLRRCGLSPGAARLADWIEALDGGLPTFLVPSSGDLDASALPCNQVCRLARLRRRKPGAGGREPRGTAAPDAVEVRVRMQSYEDAATGIRGALCSLTPTADDASDEEAREILAHWSRAGRDASGAPGPEPERLAAWRARMEEIGDSFDLARIGAKATKLLQDVTGAHAVAFYGLNLPAGTLPHAAASPTGQALPPGSDTWRRVEQIGEMRYLAPLPDAFAHHQPWLSDLQSASPAVFRSLASSGRESAPAWLPTAQDGMALACVAHGDIQALALVWEDSGAWRTPTVRDLLRQIAFQTAQAMEHARWFQLARLGDQRGQRLIEHANVLIVGTDLRGAITRWNTRAAETLGLEREEVIGRPLADLLANDDAESDAMARRLGEVLTTRGERTELELAMRTRAGGTRHVVWSMGPQRAADGTDLGLLAIGQDITRRKELERDLATSEWRYRTLVETTHDLYWILEAAPTPAGEALSVDALFAQGRLAFLNRALAGHDRAALLGGCPAGLAELFRADSWRTFREGCAQALAATAPVYQVETEHPGPTPGARPIFYLSDIFPTVEAGRTVGLQILSIDVTERREVEAQVLQAQKLESIGTLARGVAHDFNNILNGIQGFLYLIETDPGNVEQTLTNSARIKELTARASRLTRQMQTYARQGRTEKRTLDLNEIVRQSVEMFRATVVAKQIEIVLTLADDIDWIEADFSQVEQVLMNLFFNAAEAMADGGTLSVATRTVAIAPPDADEVRYVSLEVRDTGAGMTPQVKARIFDPFFTTKRTGNGLGLSAVYGILKSHQALVRVDSELGIGTCFAVHFPASNRKRQVLGDAALASGAVLRGGHETILVADDEVSIRLVSEDILRTLGYRVVVAGDGTEALRIFQERPAAIDLVLMDMDMPNLGGWAAAKVMRLARPDLRVLFTSGYMDPALSDSLHEDGFGQFIDKPYSMIDLQAAVRRALDDVGMQ